MVKWYKTPTFRWNCNVSGAVTQNVQNGTKWYKFRFLWVVAPVLEGSDPIYTAVVPFLYHGCTTFLVQKSGTKVL